MTWPLGRRATEFRTKSCSSRRHSQLATAWEGGSWREGKANEQRHSHHRWMRGQHVWAVDEEWEQHIECPVRTDLSIRNNIMTWERPTKSAPKTGRSPDFEPDLVSCCAIDPQAIPFGFLLLSPACMSVVELACQASEATFNLVTSRQSNNPIIAYC